MYYSPSQAWKLFVNPKTYIILETPGQELSWEIQDVWQKKQKYIELDEQCAL